MEDIKIGDFFIQCTEEGKILRKAVDDSKFHIDYMYETFEKHGYYPLTISNCKLIRTELIKLDLC